MTTKLVKKHTLASRWHHWINFPLLAIMMWSGLLIYWAHGAYTISLFGHQLFAFFPKAFYKALGVPYHLADGLKLHFLFMWFFLANGLCYVIYTLVSGEWRSLLPLPGSLRRALQVLAFDLRLSKVHPPQGKYNDAQRLAYTGVVLMGVGSVLTGLAIYKPTSFAWLTWLLGGYEAARWEHFWLTIFYVCFFVIHILQVVRAGWGNFSSMISGYARKEQP